MAACRCFGLFVAGHEPFRIGNKIWELPKFAKGKSPKVGALQLMNHHFYTLPKTNIQLAPENRLSQQERKDRLPSDLAVSFREGKTSRRSVFVVLQFTPSTSC